MTLFPARIARVALPLALIAGFAQAASAQIIFTTILSGDQATPPTGSPATGSGTFVVNPVTNTIDYNIAFSGLVGNETAAHLHEGATGIPGGIFAPLSLGSPKIGTINYNQVDEAAILSGRMYVNIHSSVFGGGEIRGQILRSPLPYCEGTAMNCPCGNGGTAGSGCANATGTGAVLTWDELNSTVLDNFQLRLINLPPNQFGLVYNGNAATSGIPFGEGLRCVGGTSVNRFPIHNSGPGGMIMEGPGIVGYTLANFPAAGQITAGQTWYFQGWYRDPNGPCGISTFNLSNALEVTFEL